MKPYKIFTKNQNKLKKAKVVGPLKIKKIPLYFCKSKIDLPKGEIVLPN